MALPQVQGANPSPVQEKAEEPEVGHVGLAVVGALPPAQPL